VSSAARDHNPSLEQLIKEEARRLGFILAGVTIPGPPEHFRVLEAWLAAARHGTMSYMSDERSRTCREDPRHLMPECKSIIVLAAPYSSPGSGTAAHGAEAGEVRGRVAAYAWGDDYHDVLPGRMRALVRFVEEQIGRPIASRRFTDSAPILERDLAQRAGLGWIGKNTCLINPHFGSYVLLCEILLDLELASDAPFTTDHCGSCTRCLDACPTGCILPDRTIDARRCISYLTIELRGSIPVDLRLKMGNWIFGCDICQMVCPWNRFSPPEGDPAFKGDGRHRGPPLQDEQALFADDFKQRFRDSPIRRAKAGGYLRNVAVAAGNSGDRRLVPALRAAADNSDPVLQEHCEWAIDRITGLVDTHA
jgi:epoxyqueuosine reductase